MKNMKRATAIILIALMSLSLIVACGNNAADPGTPEQPIPATETTPTPTPTPTPTTPDDPGVTAPAPEVEGIRFADHFILCPGNQPVAVLNPFSPAAGGAAQWAFTMIYDRLIARDWEAGVFIPSLATSWEISEDVMRYTFFLRDDVYFHNGDKFTAQDVYDTIMLSRDGPGSHAHTAWRHVDTINIIDTYTIELILSVPTIYFMHDLLIPAAGIVNRRAIEADPETGTFIGTGAYIVTGFSTNDYVEFVRNDNYWGELPITRYQTWRNIPETSTRTVMLQNGEIHLSASIGTEDRRLFQDNPDFLISALFFNSPFGIIFNTEDPIMGDINFRRAVAHAVDKEEIALFASGDWAQPPESGAYWGYATEFFNHNIPLLPFDLDRARAYLEASAYNGETIVITSVTGPELSRAAEVLQQQLSRIGITIELNLMDMPSMLAATSWENNTAQMIVFSSMFALDAGSAALVFTPGITQNRSRYNNPEVVEMFELARTTLDDNARRAIYMQIQEIVAEDLPLLNLFWLSNVLIGTSNVGGVQLFSMDQRNDFRNVFVILDN